MKKMLDKLLNPVKSCKKSYSFQMCEHLYNRPLSAFHPTHIITFLSHLKKTYIYGSQAFTLLGRHSLILSIIYSGFLLILLNYEFKKLLVVKILQIDPLVVVVWNSLSNFLSPICQRSLVVL